MESDGGIGEDHLAAAVVADGGDFHRDDLQTIAADTKVVSPADFTFAPMEKKGEGREKASSQNFIILLVSPLPADFQAVGQNMFLLPAGK